MSDRAVIEADLTGVGRVESGAKKITRSLKDAKAAGADVRGASDEAVGKIDQLVSKLAGARAALTPTTLVGGAVGAGVTAGLSALASALSKATSAASAFAAATGRTSRLTETSQLRLQQEENRVQQATGIAPEESGAFVEGVQAHGGDPKKAIEAMLQIAKLAKAEGRSMGDYVENFVTLTRGMGLSAEAAATKLGALSEQAKRLKVIGGPQALIDSLAQLAPTLEDVSKKSPKATQDVEAFFRVLVAKGMAPQKALAAVQAGVGFVKSNAEGQYSVKSLLGHETLDQGTGQALQPIEDLLAVERRLRKRYRSETQRESSRRATYGTGDLAVVMKSLTDAELRTEGATQDRDTSAERFRSYASSPGGAQSIAEGEQEVERRRLGKPIDRAWRKVTRAGTALETAGLRLLQGRDNFNTGAALADDVSAAARDAAPPAAGPALTPADLDRLGKAAGDAAGRAATEAITRQPVKATIQRTGPGRNDQGGD